MISVVIPLYNKEATIISTVSSVLNQVFTDFELVIVDDGSTDNGVNVIKSFTNDSRVKIFQQENQGVSVARNKGVEIAIYEYVAFLDGDDLWEPEYLEKMVEGITRYPEAGMFCCAGKVRSGGNDTLRLAEKYKKKISPINFFENPHVFLHTSATIIAKKYFKKAYGFPVGMKRNQDFAFFFSLALITPQVVYCGYPLSIYVGDVEGQTTGTPFVQVIEHVSKRFKHVYNSYKLTENKNTAFIIFLKYELRHLFKVILNNEEHKVLLGFIALLDKEIINEFSSLELALYKKKKFKKIALLFIDITKIRWKLRGYPRV